MTNPVRQLDRGARVVYAVAPAGENAFVHPRMKIGEAVGEMHFLAVHRDAAIGLSLISLAGRHVRRIAREKPPDGGPLEFKMPCDLSRRPGRH